VLKLREPAPHSKPRTQFSCGSADRIVTDDFVLLLSPSR